MAPRTRFRPCIDLHEGRVKQIVGGTLDETEQKLRTNFVSSKDSSWFAQLYASDQLYGGHVIQLGSGNEASAKAALAAYPKGLQIGGGIRPENATDWLSAGASHVIATSCLFDADGAFQENQLDALVSEVGKEQLVIDLSCRQNGDRWVVAMNKWQTPTDLHIEPRTLDALANSCAEFLVHAADVEGLCSGVDEDLVRLLGSWGKIPITYAGGARSLDDLSLVHSLSNGKVDLTIGSALDIFGGENVSYRDCVAFNQRPAD